MHESGVKYEVLSADQVIDQLNFNVDGLIPVIAQQYALSGTDRKMNSLLKVFDDKG